MSLHVRSLSNNNLEVLPRDLFKHLDILTDLYVPDTQTFPCEGLKNNPFILHVKNSKHFIINEKFLQTKMISFY